MVIMLACFFQICFMFLCNRCCVYYWVCQIRNQSCSRWMNQDFVQKRGTHPMYGHQIPGFNSNIAGIIGFTNPHIGTRRARSKPQWFLSNNRKMVSGLSLDVGTKNSHRAPRFLDIYIYSNIIYVYIYMYIYICMYIYIYILLPSIYIYICICTLYYIISYHILYYIILYCIISYYIVLILYYIISY
jgi:hypothetical protein